MSHRPYPNPRRALRHLVRGHRVTRRTWRDGVANHVDVYVYPGLVSKGVEAEVRRMLSRDRQQRLSAK